jgi:hypothetical protein
MSDNQFHINFKILQTGKQKFTQIKFLLYTISHCNISVFQIININRRD